MGVRGQGAEINPFIWVAVGAIIGWAFGLLGAGSGKVSRLEEVLVGVFGAFVGGEFVADMLRGSSTEAFSASSLGLAAAGAVVLLVLLKIMRGAVGPLRSGKSPSARRR
jgi:uncharacterized membrane protein YeaQ/YmgE (transglycosylase-associated protein family)